MAGCCDPSGYESTFGRRAAERAVRGFEERGLDSTAGPMVVALTDRGLSGKSVLEVGAGSGTALVTMLEAGAATGVGVDLSPHHQEAADSLLRRRGLSARVSWHTADFVAAAPGIDRTDIVFLNRVVCCYPDMTGMIDAATGHAETAVAVSYPRRWWLTRIGIGVINLVMRLRRNTFRVFVHDPRRIGERVADAGFEEVASGRTLAWEWRVWERVAIGA